MRRFPTEFTELLNQDGKKLLARPNGPRSGAILTLTGAVMDPATAVGCVRLLDRHLYPTLRPLVQPIPRDSIRAMTRNYSEKLPKTVSVKTCFLQSPRYRAYETAERIGLVAMLRSESLRLFAERATGLRLEGGTDQAICYEHGDYSGPHNDHHPEDWRLRDGYVDLHIMFGNGAVDHQWLVYEEGRHLRKIASVNVAGGLAVYRLPFWHYTTPLAGKPGLERKARRWLVMVSYTIARGPKRPAG